MFQSLSESITAALGIIKPEPPTTAVVELGKQGQMMESRPHPETLISWLMQRKVAVFTASPFRFRDSGCSKISVPPVRVSRSMTGSQPNK